MRYGGAVVLIVLGAIITFALNFEVQFVERETIGFILMAAGAFGLVLSLILDLKPKKQVVAQDRVDAAGVQEHEVRENKQV